jgi:formylglycine-generating enzyme
MELVLPGRRVIMKLPLSLLMVVAAALPVVVLGEESVQPPKIPHISTEPSEEAVLKLPRKSQPAALHDQLAALSEGTLDERIAKLKAKALGDLVFMQGGTFMMGDFGSLWSPDGTNYAVEGDARPAHKVRLSSFSISRYKTTYSEYDVYLDATSQPREDSTLLPYRNAFVPAGMKWYQAKNYCQWLGKQTGVPFDLPTEAQWEYAARSRGQFFVFGTDNGHLDFGRNINAYKELKLIQPASDNVEKHGNHPQVSNYPVGMFPPSPMGLYDLTTDGREWTGDWYADDYYKHSPEVDPQGPSIGTLKVARSSEPGEGPLAMVVVMRYPIKPGTRTFTFKNGQRVTLDPISDGVRCVVNLDHPVAKQN